MRPRTCAVRSQVPSRIIREASVVDSIGGRVKRVTRAWAIRVLVGNARHIAVAVVRKGQIVRGGTSCYRGHKAIHVVIR